MEQRRLERLAAHAKLPSAAAHADPAHAASGGAGGPARAAVAASHSADDVVVVAAMRTPIGKSRRGAFKDTTPDVLLAAAVNGTLKKAGVAAADVGDVVVGNTSQFGAGQAGSRMGLLASGVPYTVPLMTVNRQCSSGLQAVANAAASIRAGTTDVALGCGVESMSTNPMTATPPPDVDYEAVGSSKDAQGCMVAMGVTSENVAERYGVTREEQDALAVESHRRAAAAQKAGAFDDEIVPVEVDGKRVTRDEGVREGTSMEVLGKLRAVFKEGGTTTAGNSSQTSDGAAAVLLARRSVARARGWPIIGSLRSFAVVGVKPDEMGIGPAVAIPRALELAGVSQDQLDAVELNEAFASQAAYCIRELKLDPKIVNPNGGAIALGHPLGCTGARQVATLLNHLGCTGGRYGCVSMCIGTGMGAAAVFERE